MAIYRQPPSPFVGGRQPLDSRDLNPSAEAVEVNDPVPNRSPAILIAILIAWQPGPPLPQRQILLPQEFVAVEEKVPFKRHPLGIYPDYFQFISSEKQIFEEEKVPFIRQNINYVIEYHPQLPKRLPVDVIAVPEDNPPFTSRTNLPTIINWWIPPTYVIQPKLGVITEVAAEEKVSFKQYQPIQYPEGYLPQLPRKLPVDVTAVPENDPPFTSRTNLPAILIAWEPGPPRPFFGNKATPSLISVQPDNPPFTSRTVLPILQSWIPGPPYPWLGYKINPSLSAVPEDNPPFTSRTNLPTILNWWIPPPPKPQTGVGLVIEFVAPVEEKVPYKSHISTIVSNWSEVLYQIQTPTHLPTVIEEFIPYARPQLYIILDSLPLPQLPNKIASLIPFVPPVVNDPPFNSRDFRVVNIWNIPVSPHVQKYNQHIPEPAVVNDPPFGRRVLWLNTVLDAWIPPPPSPWNPITHVAPPPSGDIIIWLWKRVL